MTFYRTWKSIRGVWKFHQNAWHTGQNWWRDGKRKIPHELLMWDPVVQATRTMARGKFLSNCTTILSGLKYHFRLLVITKLSEKQSLIFTAWCIWFLHLSMLLLKLNWKSVLINECLLFILVNNWPLVINLNYWLTKLNVHR